MVKGTKLRKGGGKVAKVDKGGVVVSVADAVDEDDPFGLAERDEAGLLTGNDAKKPTDTVAQRNLFKADDAADLKRKALRAIEHKVEMLITAKKLALLREFGFEVIFKGVK